MKLIQITGFDACGQEEILHRKQKYYPKNFVIIRKKYSKYSTFAIARHPKPNETIPFNHEFDTSEKNKKYKVIIL